MSQPTLSESHASVEGDFEPGNGRKNGRLSFRQNGFLAPRGRFLRYVASGMATMLLLGFLSFSRWLDSREVQPDTTIRLLTGIDAVEIQAPPPPPPSEPPPPPPKTPPLPKLDIQINSAAPPIKATTDPDVRPSMLMATFSNDRPMERKRMIFSLNDLDSQPKLLHRPSVNFRNALQDHGLDEVRVLLQVKIHPDGQVDVIRVIDSVHPEFSNYGVDFATQARFTPPQKDGRAVATVFTWPLLLR